MGYNHKPQSFKQRVLYFLEIKETVIRVDPDCKYHSWVHFIGFKKGVDVPHAYICKQHGHLTGQEVNNLHEFNQLTGMKIFIVKEKPGRKIKIIPLPDFQRIINQRDARYNSEEVSASC